MRPFMLKSEIFHNLFLVFSDNMDLSLNGQFGGKTSKIQILDQVCQICNDAATSHKHFGGSYSCYSCRAFFRRIVRKSKTNPCRNYRNCEINIENRKNCGYCRFQKCLKSGMDPDLVMTKEDIMEKKEKVRLIVSNNLPANHTTKYQQKLR